MEGAPFHPLFSHAQITCCPTHTPTCCPWPHSSCLGDRRVSSTRMRNTTKPEVGSSVGGVLRPLQPRRKHSPPRPLLPLVFFLTESLQLGHVALSRGLREPDPPSLQVFLAQDHTKEPTAKLRKSEVPPRPHSPLCGLKETL